MSAKDLASIAFRTLAVWLFASGVGGLFSSLLTWAPDVATYGQEPSTWRLAAASIFIPIGALLWLASDALAGMAFRGPEHPGSISLGRADLYAFASVLVGMFLLSDAITQIVYWIVVWRGARGTGFWEAIQGYSTDTVVHWVHVRAQVGLVAAKAVLGTGLVLGPERLKAAVARIRGELSGSLAEEEPADASRGGRADGPEAP